MRNRYSKILCLLLLFACCLPQEGNAFWPFKKNKKVQTAHGLMTIHKVEGKVYVEFPVAMLGREMLFASSIENTSDGGEGAPGQLGGTDVRFRFEMIDSTLVARMPLLSKPVNTSGDAYIARALDNAHNPGIFKSFKVLACTPDSSALVVDMKGLFLEGSAFTKPFPSTSANGYYGFVSRDHSLQSDKSAILGVSASENHISVREELSYTVDHTLMGAYNMYKDVPLTAVVTKMLCILPEEPMTPRLADSRLGLTTQLKSDYSGATQEVKSIRYAKRWRIEPSDSAAYRRGELVRPVKQLVFYIDSLMPVKWNPYIKAGAESWNKAFEKIGFKDVICVKEFPKNDTLFNANSFDCMTIRYSASWLNSAQTTIHSDTRTGEILNASILINANMISVQYADRIGATVAIDPRVRTTVFPQEIQGELIQAAIAQAVGTGLGLTMNWGASCAYPVDSLRSASFTQKYGLASSVMGGVIINDVATEEDVRNGVCLVNAKPGPYDELVIKYLYQPIYASSLQEEKETLDSWIREHTGDPYYAYIRNQSRFDSDPRNSRGSLGDDHLKSFDYMLPNVRKGFENYYSWFAKEDRDFLMRRRVHSALSERLSGRIYAILSYIGGIYLNDIREKDAIPSYSMVDREKQKAALSKALELAKNNKKIPLDIVVSNVILRISKKYGIRVNWAGTRVYKEYNTTDWNRFLQIHANADGSKFLNVKPKNVPLDELVADAYNPMPKDGKKYILIHKDGDLGNCQANNLEWKQVRKYKPTATKRKLDNGLEVKVDGTILDKKKALPIVKEIGDSDTDSMKAIEHPYVSYRRKNKWGNYEDKTADVDDLMAAAEYVDGDKSTMKRPRVLHKNMDYKDFHALNLKWVEESSPEYQEYMKRKKEDIDKLTKELNWNNPNFKLPDNQ